MPSQNKPNRGVALIVPASSEAAHSIARELETRGISVAPDESSPPDVVIGTLDPRAPEGRQAYASLRLEYPDARLLFDPNPLGHPEVLRETVEHAIASRDRIAQCQSLCMLSMNLLQSLQHRNAIAYVLELFETLAPLEGVGLLLTHYALQSGSFECHLSPRVSNLPRASVIALGIGANPSRVFGGEHEPLPQEVSGLGIQHALAIRLETELGSSAGALVLFRREDPFSEVEVTRCLELRGTVSHLFDASSAYRRALRRMRQLETEATEGLAQPRQRFIEELQLAFAHTASKEGGPQRPYFPPESTWSLARDLIHRLLEELPEESGLHSYIAANNTKPTDRVITEIATALDECFGAVGALRNILRANELLPNE